MVDKGTQHSANLRNRKRIVTPYRQRKRKVILYVFLIMLGYEGIDDTVLIRALSMST